MILSQNSILIFPLVILHTKLCIFLWLLVCMLSNEKISDLSQRFCLNCNRNRLYSRWIKTIFAWLECMSMSLASIYVIRKWKLTSFDLISLWTVHKCRCSQVDRRSSIQNFILLLFTQWNFPFPQSWSFSFFSKYNFSEWQYSSIFVACTFQKQSLTNSTKTPGSWISHASFRVSP